MLSKTPGQSLEDKKEEDSFTHDGPRIPKPNTFVKPTPIGKVERNNLKYDSRRQMFYSHSNSNETNPKETSPSMTTTDDSDDDQSVIYGSNMRDFFAGSSESKHEEKQPVYDGPCLSYEKEIRLRLRSLFTDMDGDENLNFLTKKLSLSYSTMTEMLRGLKFKACPETNRITISDCSTDEIFHSFICKSYYKPDPRPWFARDRPLTETETTKDTINDTITWNDTVINPRKKIKLSDLIAQHGINKQPKPIEITNLNLSTQEEKNNVLFKKN
jgi:hypothetical protein